MYLIKKIFDACRSKECVRDLRVYLTRCSQELLEHATAVKPRRAELLWVDIDVQPVEFNRGFFSVDVRYYYRIYAEVSAGCGRMQDICGLACYDKRVILYGSEGTARIFSSQEGCPNSRTFERANKPVAVVETCAVDDVRIKKFRHRLWMQKLNYPLDILTLRRKMVD